MAAIDQIVAYFGIGAGSDATRRFVQFVTPQGGWQGFVDNEIAPMLDRGIRRFMLWMPHGREARTRRQLMGNYWYHTDLRHDAWRLARKNLTHNWFTTGFAEAISPLTQAGVEVIAYVGSMHGAPEYDQLPRGMAVWDGVKVIAPILDARCSIAFDSSCFSKPGHYLYNMVALLKQAGFRCYIESSPLANGNHWFDTPCVISELQWVNVINPSNWHYLAAPNRLTGEIVRGWFQPVPPEYGFVYDWYAATVPPALDEGYTCCLPLKWYFYYGGTIDLLLP